MQGELETHDIDGIGEFRAKSGTAVSELAGASAYWAKRAKLAERKVSSTQWAAFGYGAAIGCLAAALISFLIH